MRRRTGTRLRRVGVMLVLVVTAMRCEAGNDNAFDPTRPVVAIETVRAMMDSHLRAERAADAAFNAEAGAAVSASKAEAPAGPVAATNPAAALARTLNPGVDPAVGLAVSRADAAHRAAGDSNVLPFDEVDGGFAVARVGRTADKRGQQVLSTTISVPTLANWVNVVAPGHPAYGRAVPWDTAMRQLREFNARNGIQLDRPPRPDTGRMYIGQPTNVVTQAAPEQVPDGVQVDPLTGERFDTRTGKTLPNPSR